jgi:hypothetical protein
MAKTGRGGGRGGERRGGEERGGEGRKEKKRKERKRKERCFLTQRPPHLTPYKPKRHALKLHISTIHDSPKAEAAETLISHKTVKFTVVLAHNCSSAVRKELALQCARYSGFHKHPDI